MRTPTKNKNKLSPSTSATDKETEAELPSVREPAPTPVNEAQISMGEKEATMSQTEVKRLYVLVRDGEIQTKSKREDQPTKDTNKAEAKEGELELDKRIEKLETISKSFEKMVTESEERVMAKLGEIRSYAEVAAVARTEPRNDCARTVSNDRRETGLYSLLSPGKKPKLLRIQSKKLDALLMQETMDSKLKNSKR
ncbi:unnamed protein product [Pieris macdunnoughi]|uniref:Uncharacterized protein n=1 Tax=Pieris macdunnoughi TaxID=345717 RepID=A0A821R5I8_9NEOP|nr:unnamed protein product [Pieris macdunnoughi]